MAQKDFSQMNRNFNGIQFSELRKKIDGKYNLVHDELSDCYYNKKPFGEYGILTKEVFDKLHGLIFLLRDVEFHQENLKQPESERIPEVKYNNIYDSSGNIVGKKFDKTTQKINDLATEGIVLRI